MTFEQLVDRLVSLYDVTQPRAVDVANERLNQMVVESEALRAIISLGTTTADDATYSLAANVAKVLAVEIEFSTGKVEYEGAATVTEFWKLAADQAFTDGALYVEEPDSDADMNTSNLRLWPAPPESGKTITGLVALAPATIVYASATALPVPSNVHRHLLAGAKADLSDDEGNQADSAKFEGVFGQGVQLLKKRAAARAKGGTHRMKVRGYDFARR